MQPVSPSPRVAIVGGDPAGLMTAEILLRGGVQVDLFDAMAKKRAFTPKNDVTGLATSLFGRTTSMFHGTTSLHDVQQRRSA